MNALMKNESGGFMKKNFFLALAVIAFVISPIAWSADLLDGAAIKVLFAGKSISGVNSFGNPYRVEYLKDGNMDGVAGFNNEYVDTGRWWIDGDKFCRQYSTWFEGVAGCYGISVEGDSVRFHGDDGNVLSESILE
ncbi:MAG: hypothetical protein AAF420_00440 [Pseudomonadota bacterium]